MPIQIRPSDVVLGLADTLQKTSQAAGQIAAMSYEADRVSWVNRQLAFEEQGYERYNADVTKRTIAVQPEPNLPIGLNPSMVPADVQEASEVQHLPFGQAPWSAVEKDAEEFFQSQLEYITRTTTNKAAREEMIQHLTMKHIQNLSWLRGQHQIAAYHEWKASTNVVVEQVLSSAAPYNIQVLQLDSRIDEGVNVGWLNPDDGQEVKAGLQAQAHERATGRMEAKFDAAVADRSKSQVDEIIEAEIASTLISEGSEANGLKALRYGQINYGAAQDVAFGELRRKATQEELDVPFDYKKQPEEALAAQSERSPEALMLQRADNIIQLIRQGWGPFGEITADEQATLESAVVKQRDLLRSDMKFKREEATRLLEEDVTRQEAKMRESGVPLAQGYQDIIDFIDTLEDTWEADSWARWRDRYVRLQEDVLADAEDIAKKEDVALKEEFLSDIMMGVYTHRYTYDVALEKLAAGLRVRPGFELTEDQKRFAGVITTDEFNKYENILGSQAVRPAMESAMAQFTAWLDRDGFKDVSIELLSGRLLSRVETYLGERMWNYDEETKQYTLAGEIDPAKWEQEIENIYNALTSEVRGGAAARYYQEAGQGPIDLAHSMEEEKVFFGLFRTSDPLEKQLQAIDDGLLVGWRGMVDDLPWLPANLENIAMAYLPDFNNAAGLVLGYSVASVNPDDGHATYSANTPDGVTQEFRLAMHNKNEIFQMKDPTTGLWNRVHFNPMAPGTTDAKGYVVHPYFYNSETGRWELGEGQVE